MDDMGKLRNKRLLHLVMVSLLLGACSTQRQPTLTVLDSRVTMKVYSAEILESVISRLAANTGQDIRYNTLMLLPYKAKAAEYRGVTVRSILDEQLKDTPFVYGFQKKKLIIELKNNGTTQR